jgi:PIN domain nuclease of toxin-antitoxin system
MTLGRLRLKDDFALLVEKAGFEQLPITFKHAAYLRSLPPHHADPFDRMLVAQALVEGVTLVSHDRALEPYSVSTIWT